jgi:hypothetical protein
MPYFFSNAALTGRTSWLMIWVEYQLTSPSFLAAAIKAASAANAEPAASDKTSTQAIVKVGRAMVKSPFFLAVQIEVSRFSLPNTNREIDSDPNLQEIDSDPNLL